MAENKPDDHEYKVQAVKLAKEIKQAKAAKELGSPKNTLYGCLRPWILFIDSPKSCLVRLCILCHIVKWRIHYRV